MKIQLIVLFCLILFIPDGVYAQKIILNDMVNFEMPAQSQKLTTAEKNDYAAQKNIKSIMFPDHRDKTTYLLDSVIISIRVSKQEQKVVLTNLKRSLEAGNFGNKTKLLTINGNTFLIDQNQLNNQIWFFGTDQLGCILINGLLEFSDKNKANAEIVMDKVFKGISYVHR